MRRSRHEKEVERIDLDLVRRVIIIAIEDVVLHPDLPVLAWIMAACSKGFRASKCIYFRSSRCSRSRKFNLSRAMLRDER